MPLPDPPERAELHHRSIEMRGYRRPDGLFEIDGRVVDRKTHDLPMPSGGKTVAAGSPVHDMAIRLVVDDDLQVIDIVATTDASPYPACPEATATLSCLKGERIGRGWSARVKQKLGGARSCTHLMELLMPLATAAYQTIAPLRSHKTDPIDASGRPRKIDSCYAYASDGDLVLQRWPAFHVAKNPLSD